MEQNNIKKHDRIPYIDMAKGLLILMVVIGHMQNVCKELSINDEVFIMIDHIEWFWGPFFMPAFFVITGMCSNFDKRFKPFLWSNIKGLLIPAFTLGIIVRWISFLYSTDVTFNSFFRLGIKGFLVNGGSFWFLSALFISKLTYFTLKMKVKSNYSMFAILLLMHIFGFILFSQNVCRNIWFFQHAMMMTVYLFIGQYMKNIRIDMNKKLIILNWGGYTIVVSSILLLGYDSPHIAHNVTVENMTLIPHFFISIWGIFLLIEGIKKMKPT